VTSSPGRGGTHFRELGRAGSLLTEALILLLLLLLFCRGSQIQNQDPLILFFIYLLFFYFLRIADTGFYLIYQTVYLHLHKHFCTSHFQMLGGKFRLHPTELTVIIFIILSL
jgi:hypothetical protein